MEFIIKWRKYRKLLHFLADITQWPESQARGQEQHSVWAVKPISGQKCQSVLCRSTTNLPMVQCCFPAKWVDWPPGKPCTERGWLRHSHLLDKRWLLQLISLSCIRWHFTFSMFGSTYSCESAFSTMNMVKNKYLQPTHQWTLASVSPPGHHTFCAKVQSLGNRPKVPLLSLSKCLTQCTMDLFGLWFLGWFD